MSVEVDPGGPTYLQRSLSPATWPPPTGPPRLPPLSRAVAPPSPPVPPPTRGWKQTVAAIVAIAIVVAVGAGLFMLSRGTATASQKVCKRLNVPGLSVSEGERVLSNAGANGVSLSDVHRECPDIVDAVRSGSLMPFVRVEIASCDSGSITGTVVNSSQQSIDVTLRYELLAADGTTRGDGRVVVEGIKPGQTRTWRDSKLRVRHRTCKIAIESVRPAN